MYYNTSICFYLYFFMKKNPKNRYDNMKIRREKVCFSRWNVFSFVGVRCARTYDFFCVILMVDQKKLNDKLAPARIPKKISIDKLCRQCFFLKAFAYFECFTFSIQLKLKSDVFFCYAAILGFRRKETIIWWISRMWNEILCGKWRIEIEEEAIFY